MIEQEDRHILAENDVALFYENSTSKSATDYAKRNGLKNLIVYIAERKDGTEKDFIIRNNGVDVYASKSIESVWGRINALSFLASHDE